MSSRYSRWGESATLEFVKLYLKHECLWNPQHDFYTLKFHRDKALRQLVEEFRKSKSISLTISEARNKIKNLRTTYCQQVQKILKKSSPDAIYEPSLIWFRVMDEHLKHVPSVKKIVTSMADSSKHQSDEVNTSEVDSSCLIWVSQDMDDSTSDLNPDPLVPEDTDYISDHATVIKREGNPSPLPYKKSKKKKLKRRSSEHLSESNSNSESREDEFDIYGKFIAEQLRRMDLQKALRLQLEIQSLVSKARMSDI